MIPSTTNPLQPGAGPTLFSWLMSNASKALITLQAPGPLLTLYPRALCLLQSSQHPLLRGADVVLIVLIINWNLSKISLNQIMATQE